jgi:hypothetical protein
LPQARNSRRNVIGLQCRRPRVMSPGRVALRSNQGLASRSLSRFHRTKYRSLSETPIWFIRQTAVTNCVISAPPTTPRASGRYDGDCRLSSARWSRSHR